MVKLTCEIRDHLIDYDLVSEVIWATKNLVFS